MEEAPVGFLPTAERRLVAEWLAIPHDKRSFLDWRDTKEAMERAFTDFWDQFRPGIECESVAVWSYPAFTDGWFLGLMVSDVVSFLPRHSSERGNVHRRRGEQPGEVRSASVAPALHRRFRPHG